MRWTISSGTTLVTACIVAPRGGAAFSGAGSEASLDGGGPHAGSADGTAGPGSASASAATIASATAADTTAASYGGPKLDVGVASATAGDDEAGCEKVDFLFVIDNSGSMQEEQAALVASFDGFMTTIADTLMAQDYHIMVVDTDAESLAFGSISCSSNNGANTCSCTPEPQCCFAACGNNGPIILNPPPSECGGYPCEDFELPTGCAVVLGAGKAEDVLGHECGLEGGRRYMTDTQPDLVGSFACAALVGAGGDGNERAMEAMSRAITTETDTGGCHEGFLRDDAILVVTFISDEEDLGSTGTPSTWRQTLIDAKLGNEEAIVVLGLLADPGVPGGVCSEDEAEDAPMLRQFAESFTRGQWASVCSPSYNQFFEDAVSVIDTSCEEFVPVG